MESSGRLKRALRTYPLARGAHRLAQFWFIPIQSCHRCLRDWKEPLIDERSAVKHNQRKGAALLEFALTLPVLLFLLLGIMEFASVFFVRHAILHAASEATRSYAIGESTESEAETLALGELSAINASFAVSASPQSDTSVERWVEVSLPMNQAALGDPLNVLGNSDLTVRVTMRREEQ